MTNSRRLPLIAVCLMLGILLKPLDNYAKNRVNPQNAERAAEDSACRGAGPKGCVELALQAMGGRERIARIETLRLDEIGNTLLTEQSYRQEPFITSYERTHETIDFKKGRVRRASHLTWPESDAGQAESDAVLIASAAGGVYHSAQGDAPCGLADLDSASDDLALSPARLLLTALGAPDLHFEASKVIRSTPHTIIAFTWRGVPVRILLNPFNQLPDAVESTRVLHDFWYFWGDVNQRIYFDNYQVFHGLIYPTNFVEERNSILWRSTQILKLETNVAAEDSLFQMNEKVAAQSAQGKGWEPGFQAAKGTELPAGVTLYAGAWNSTIIKQQDGIYILEAPISGSYFQGVVDRASRDAS